MAKVMSPRILTSSTSLLFPSTHSQKSLFPPQSVAVITKPISKARSSRKPSGLSPMAKASSSTASAAVPDDIADVLGEVSIFTAAGEPVKFKDLWDQKEVSFSYLYWMAVVALLRHFGCFFCWEFAEALRESKEKFDLAGVKLIVVGVGTPDKAQVLAERLPFPLDSLYADPDRKAKVFSRVDALKKAMKNYTIKATPDDRSSVLQQGGMFVFKGKQLLYARKDEGSGDHAPLDDIFNICCEVPAA
ncbi:UNVERIFIED_CONTAM: hypothetical protein Sradi_0772500 [Sesamum radiatum]|uniref:Thioredoxin-like protein AAED1, chloroplastic n=1 Tax=Sesamum radiatum TaxID=300843 RepID=A0AAW2VRP8_SESRA